MVYCHKCGNQNPDEAQFCQKCGAPLHAPAAPQWQPRREDCDRGGEPCTGSKRGDAIFWGIIVILIGLWILFEFVLKNIEGMPQWIVDFEFWWLFGLVIGIAIIVAGLRLIMKGSRS